MLFGETFTHPCGTETEPDGAICPGTLTFEPGDVQARCDTCGGWAGRYAPTMCNNRTPIPPAGHEGFRTVPAAKGSLGLDHTADCLCSYRYHPNLPDDVKLIDTRCIAAYHIPARS